MIVTYKITTDLDNRRRDNTASFERASADASSAILFLKEILHVADAPCDIGQQHGDIVRQEKLLPVVVYYKTLYEKPCQF